MSRLVGFVSVSTTERFRQQVHFDGFVATPVSGKIRIQRSDTSYYWNGSTWQSTETTLTTTVDSTNKEHYYDLAITTDLQSVSLDINMKINNDPLTQDQFRVFCVGSATGGSGSGSIVILNE
jgi:hypothetical protein